MKARFKLLYGVDYRADLEELASFFDAYSYAIDDDDTGEVVVVSTQPLDQKTLLMIKRRLSINPVSDGGEINGLAIKYEERDE